MKKYVKSDIKHVQIPRSAYAAFVTEKEKSVPKNPFLLKCRQGLGQGWVWLFLLNLALLGMVFLGGMTRLTGSGLSIVAWKPLSGILPPLTHDGWEALFQAYQSSPEFKQMNWYFTLEDFKGLFWLEYLHRLLGRLLGVLLLIPTILFWKNRSVRWGLLGMWMLGGIQGAFGWWMVKSGLVHNPWVSPFRLTGHLLLALLIFSISWTLFLKHGVPCSPFQGRAVTHTPCHRRLKRAFIVSGILLSLTITWGGLVAGTKAGLLYNTFPLMDGQFFPDSFLLLDPWWHNFLENPGSIQWAHRLLALSTGASLLYVVWLHPCLWILGVGVMGQILLGIWTLLSQVSIWFAVSHQVWAFVLVGLWLWGWRKCGYMAPD